MPKMVSLRLDEELLVWADGYAQERGVSRTEIVAEALRSLREDSERSVPDLPALKETWDSEALARQMVAPGASLKFAREIEASVAARQAKLNKAKYG